MAAKQPKPEPTAAERAVQDRVKRAKRSYPRVDRYGHYMTACSELAQECGGDVVTIYAEFESRVTALLYTDEPDLYEAEQRAMDHVRAAWTGMN